MKRNIVLTSQDLERLKKLVAEESEFGKAKESKELKALQIELERAHVVEAEQIPSGTITMNSKFLMKHLNSEERTEYSLVYPEDSNFLENKISVMAPIGTAMLGYHEGDEIDWQVPEGTVRLKIEKVLYQPEASGHFEL
ncbi:nucleoside diphosphate kinase regulator [Acidaminobacter sp.]|uniref:nucleoside diphosphate kinase regulator n=1 Tax=Acidaminobacter sp. TaxID=1872102 RepID=UPI001382804C|nr:nucleoside diphosphate kinase regulator [Acidaminobacter sp.]MDK9711085.1 nucleoside diphosphate kinase regulator [Acidaminobacter sp.]MZQ97347.1 nucleoside diphosphate kinase regulator [Acidaminobacter sp.]